MFTISKDFHFSASHRLRGLPADHPCSRMHGHNYIVRVGLRNEVLGDTGFVVDYGDLKPFGEWLDDNMDHRHLNDVMTKNPTAENMAFHLAGIVRSLVALPPATRVLVSVSETPKTWATFGEVT